MLLVIIGQLRGDLAIFFKCKYGREVGGAAGTREVRTGGGKYGRAAGGNIPLGNFVYHI